MTNYSELARQIALARDGYNDGGEIVEPVNDPAWAKFLTSEKDTTPYTDTYQRGYIAPVGVSGYTGKAEPALNAPLNIARNIGAWTVDQLAPEEKPLTLWERLMQPVDLAKSLITAPYHGMKELMKPGRYEEYFGGTDANKQEQIGWSMDAAGGAMTGGLAVPKPSNTLGIFGGKLAKTADQAALTRAEELAASGAPREQIWKETGWFKGVDGKWRFEIDDSKAGFQKPASWGDLEAGKPITDKFTHEDLFAAYPDNAPKLTPVDGSNGVFRPSDNEIGITGVLPRNRYNDKKHFTGAAKDQNSTTLHELQHWVQNTEGFASGTNPHALVDDIAEARFRTTELKAKIERLNNEAYDEAGYYLSRATSEGGDYADYVAIPSGKTVLSYNPGNEHGMSEFYDKIVPKNLTNILSKLDAEDARRFHADKLETPGKGLAGAGFTLFPLTPVAKEKILSGGLELFSNPKESAAVSAAIQAGKQEPAAARAALPMDQASRLARAREMGFDVETPMYHGSNGPWDGDGFVPSKGGNLGPGSYLSQEPRTASGYAERLQGGDSHLMDNGHVTPVYARGKIATSAEYDKYLDAAKADGFAAQSKVDEAHRRLKADGFTGIRGDNMGRVVNVFHPADIRSPNAAFDPSKRHSTNLLASNPEEGSARPIALQAGKGEPRVSIKQVQPGLYDASVGDKFVGTASVVDGKPFISAISLDPEFQRQGIGSALYSMIEKDIGRQLVPSPLGLTPQATEFWKKRLSGLTPEERAAVVNEAKAIGSGYGINDKHLRDRLDVLYSNPKESASLPAVIQGSDRDQNNQPYDDVIMEIMNRYGLIPTLEALGVSLPTNRKTERD